MSFNSDEFKNSQEFDSVRNFYNEIKSSLLEISNNSSNHNLLSLLIDYRQQYTKIFLIFCANSFEKKIMSFLPSLLRIESCKVKCGFFDVVFFNKKYHTLFQWNQNNTNSFISLFGKDVLNCLNKLRIDDDYFTSGEKAFLALGNYRNIMVHDGIINYSFALDLDSVYNKFNQSLDFISSVFEQIDRSLTD